jgi:hypothetical protein
MDMKLDGTESNLVVDGAITTDTTRHRVKLTKTADYFYNKPTQVVSGATVSISDGTNVFKLTEDASEPGVYYTADTVYGVCGKTYTLHVENVDVNGDGTTETYEASSKLSNMLTPSAITVKEKHIYYENLFEVSLFGEDPPTTDFYLFRPLINGVLTADTITEVIYSDDAMFNGADFKNGISVAYFVPDYKKDEQVVDGDTVTLEVCSITEDYYNFLSEFGQEASGHSPMFGGQPANIRTNVSNNGMGYFAAYSIARVSTIYKKESDSGTKRKK